MWKNIVTIHSVLKKRTIMQNYQPAQYKKKKSTKIILEKKRKKFIIKEKKPCRKTL